MTGFHASNSLSGASSHAHAHVVLACRLRQSIGIRVVLSVHSLTWIGSIECWRIEGTKSFWMLQQISHYPSAGRLERGKAESPTNKRRQDARSARFSVAHKAARQRSVNRIRPRPAFTNTHLPALIRVRDDAEDTKEPERQVISRAASVIRDAKAGIELPTARGGDEFSSPKNLRAGEYYISPNRSQASKKGRLEMVRVNHSRIDRVKSRLTHAHNTHARRQHLKTKIRATRDTMSAYIYNK